jgi:hypothetical protein
MLCMTDCEYLLWWWRRLLDQLNISCVLLWSVYFAMCNVIWCALRINSETTFFFSSLLTTCVGWSGVQTAFCLLTTSKSSVKWCPRMAFFKFHLDINCVCDWCISDCMKFGISKSRVASFCWKTNLLGSDYILCNSCVTQTDWIKNLGVRAVSKLHLRHHVDHIFSQPVRLMGLFRTVTSSISSL